MRKVIVFYSLIAMLLIIACSKSENEQITPNVPTGKMIKELTVNGITREYIIYVPENYNVTTAFPLLLSFHGLTSNMEFNYSYTSFDELAELENFIVVHPNGISNTWTVSANDDTDIDFIVSLLNQLEEDYNIESNRIYSTGMSMGGFFSFSLACRLSDRIAAVASVTGSMTPDTLNDCNAQHPTPVLQIHGTNDSVVPYDGNSTWTLPIVDLVSYWVNYNNCEATPTTTTFPDLDLSDGSTVEHIIYSGGDNGVTTEHMKIIGGGHTWPSSAITLPGTNQDINASMEIWHFFSRFDINGILSVPEFDNIQVNIYPNPTNSNINLSLSFSKEVNYELFSLLGKQLIVGTIKSNNQEIDLSNLPPNIYYLKLANQVFKILKTN